MDGVALNAHARCAESFRRPKATIPASAISLVPSRYVAVMVSRFHILNGNIPPLPPHVALQLVRSEEAG